MVLLVAVSERQPDLAVVAGQIEHLGRFGVNSKVTVFTTIGLFSPFCSQICPVVRTETIMQDGLGKVLRLPFHGQIHQHIHMVPGE
jgi:hypothetical protein